MTQTQLQELERNEDAEVLDLQLGLLKKRLLADPQSFRQLFVSGGMEAAAWEFQQDELGGEFTKTFWKLLVRGDGMSTVLQRFVWELPLKFKRKFIRAIDEHLSDRYPMFKGLSKGWPGEANIPPYIRPADERAKDFGLVSQGYLGYIGQGYSAREVDLFVWLEVLRDKQCDDRPCEIGLLIAGKAENKGGCPVKIHIPEMLKLLGTGRFREALGADPELQSAAQRHGPRLPAGTAMPGRLHHHRPAHRDRPARMVPAAARKADERQRRRRESGRGSQSLGQGGEAADCGDRLRACRPHQRLSPGG